MNDPAMIDDASRKGAVKAVEQIELEHLSGAQDTSMAILIGPHDGAPNFVMRRIVMRESGGMPAHTNAVEHEQYVLRGRARVGIADEIHEVSAHHVVYIPAGTPHWYDVLEAPFEFLCLVPNVPDQVKLVEPD
jgi:quercetin dioxygenase-like cupin family protein